MLLGVVVRGGSMETSDAYVTPISVDSTSCAVVHQVIVDGDGGCRAFTGGGDDLGSRVNGVAGRPDPGDAGAAVGVDRHPAQTEPGATAFIDVAPVGPRRTPALQRGRPRLLGPWWARLLHLAQGTMTIWPRTLPASRWRTASETSASG